MITRHALAIVIVLAAPAFAFAQEPVVRVSIRQPRPYLVGQEVRIDVQVLVPNFFMSPLRMPQLDVPGAVVTLPDESGLNINETVSGMSYAGIQRSYVFVAQSAGSYALPPGVITFTYAAQPGKPAEGRVAIPPTTIDVEWPAGMAPPPEAAGMIVGRTTVTQTIDGDPATVRVGGALTRTITITAERTQPMFIPPPSLTAPDGVRAYPKDPVLSQQQDERSRALVSGRRVDTVVYSFERPGTFVLPAVEVPWFNLQARRQETARAPQIAVTVTAATTTAGIAPEAPVAPVAPARRVAPLWRRVMPYALAMLVVALLPLFWTRVRTTALSCFALLQRGWRAIVRDRARHLPPLNPTGGTAS